MGGCHDCDDFVEAARGRRRQGAGGAHTDFASRVESNEQRADAVARWGGPAAGKRCWLLARLVQPVQRDDGGVCSGRSSS